MNTASPPIQVRMQPLTEAQLNQLLRIEQSTYAHPWTYGNFRDALQAGYHCQLLLGGDELIGYYIAMPGVDEAHLLNITVAPAHQRQGWGRLLLDALTLWARSQQAQCIWLEVRASNQAALTLYAAYGFRHISRRKNYYPALQAQREDAVIMSLAL